jgi:3',5'-nucleoside bisphosphate phosphatase
MLGYNTRMNLRYDLHTHSTASDGTLSPEALVRRARAQGVDVLALTDHDTTAGCGSALAVAAEVGLRLVPGVEVSVSWNGATLHILGLGVDPDNVLLQQGLAGLGQYREQRAEEIGRRLQKHGIIAAHDGARQHAGGAQVGRTHFARYLVEQGHARDLRDAFKNFLTQGKPGYVSGEWAELAQAVAWIRDAGGQAVIAHPARYKLTATKLRRLIGEFKECGGVGMEVVSGSHSRDEMFTYADHTRQHGLLASSGSDYHGPANPWIDLGRLPALPVGCVPVWTDWPCELLAASGL